MPEQKLKFSGIAPNDVVNHWSNVLPLLKQALEYTEDIGISDILKKLLEQDMQLWIAADTNKKINAFCITRLANYPRIRACEILIAAGSDMENWTGFESIISEWARENECKAIDIRGRKGWEKVHKENGYSHKETIIRKQL